jgi:hypothetical protein
MNQYIITEEVAEIIETALESDEHCKKCPYEGGGFNQGALSLLRECPYQSERERVLDDIVNMFDDGNYNGVTVKQMIRGKFREIELRQAGEP